MQLKTLWLALCGFFILTAFSAQSTTIVFIRHGEAEHNVLLKEKRYADAKALRDPHLTELGKAQAAALGEKLAGRHFDRIISSPLIRALETTRIVFSDKFASVEILSDVAEHGGGACDLGSDTDILQGLFGETITNWLAPNWFDEFVAETDEHYLARMENVKNRLSKQNDETIAVVTHGNFLRKLLNLKGSIQNCEVFEVVWP